MPIRISKALKEKLPPEQRAGIEEILWGKSGGYCHLCSGELNSATDTIYADHDHPENEGGKTHKDNLNLVHKRCNDFKRNYSTIRVRPYLKFQTFFNSLAALPKYGDCLPHFGITPTDVNIEIRNGAAIFHHAAGKETVRIFSETNSVGEFYYTYVEVGRSSIYNDDECQPRTIKLPQIWAIFSDIQRNPLHEPPSCRLSTVVTNGGKLPKVAKPEPAKLLMFDGQHKTIANWLHNRDKIVVKVYLNLDREQAIQLVNSVQSKIKKLPLSPFELAAKMAEEWRDRVARYEEVSGEKGSEKGFMEWVGQDERTRAKQAFKDALYQNVLDDESLEFRAYIASPGTKLGKIQITETTFKTKVLQQLLHLQPLEGAFAQVQPLREREAKTIVRLLNIFTSKLLEPDQGAAALSDAQLTRAKRVLYQASLSYISGLLRQVAALVLKEDKERIFLEREPTEDQWKELGECVARILNHPVWTADFKMSEKMQNIELALTKNQNVDAAFKAVMLRTGYAYGADHVDENTIKD